MAGAAFFHPLDMLGYALLTAVTTALCGLDSGGAASRGLIAVCFGFVQTRGHGFTGERWRQWGKMLRFVDVERGG